MCPYVSICQYTQALKPPAKDYMQKMRCDPTHQTSAPSSAEPNRANPANNRAADADAALLAPVWRSGLTRLDGNGRCVFELGLPGIEGAAHTSLERTGLRVGLWRHRVAAQRNGLMLEKSRFHCAVYADPDVHVTGKYWFAWWIMSCQT